MRLLKFGITGLVLLALAIAGFFYWVTRSVNSPNTHAKANEYIRIERGSTPAQIVAQLAASGIVANEMAANIYLRTLGDATKLQAGEFHAGRARKRHAGIRAAWVGGQRARAGGQADARGDDRVALRDGRASGHTASL